MQALNVDEEMQDNTKEDCALMGTEKAPRVSQSLLSIFQTAELEDSAAEVPKNSGCSTLGLLALCPHLCQDIWVRKRIHARVAEDMAKCPVVLGHADFGEDGGINGTPAIMFGRGPKERSHV